MITSHIPDHRQVLTRTGIRKRTDITPWITSIPILSIIPRKRPALPPRHNPHTQPPEQALDVDHGSHQDRPRPAKIVLKEGKAGAKTRKK